MGGIKELLSKYDFLAHLYYCQSLNVALISSDDLV